MWLCLRARSVITKSLSEISHLLSFKACEFLWQKKSWKCVAEVDRLGTVERSQLPMPLRWHVWTSQGHSHISTKQSHQMHGLEREEHLGCTWRLPGRKWEPDEWCRRNQEALWLMKIIAMMMTAQIGHPLLGCTSAAGGSRGEERKSWRKLSSSIPGHCFPDLLWRLKRSTMMVKSGHWLQELWHF